ncbi:hypothetical protein BLOT_006759 [Blomia tropicalis]|nr:hypothetical protein BLOT_006759 [Blomia tropicalis]
MSYPQQGKPTQPSMMEPPPPYTAQPGQQGAPPPGFVASGYPAQTYPATGATVVPTVPVQLQYGPSITFGATPIGVHSMANTGGF